MELCAGRAPETKSREQKKEREKKNRSYVVGITYSADFSNARLHVRYIIRDASCMLERSRSQLLEAVLVVFLEKCKKKKEKRT